MEHKKNKLSNNQEPDVQKKTERSRNKIWTGKSLELSFDFVIQKKLKHGIVCAIILYHLISISHICLNDERLKKAAK